MTIRKRIPWFVAFDLETARPAPEDGGDWNLGITCAAAALMQVDEKPDIPAWAPSYEPGESSRNSVYKSALSPDDAWDFAAWLLRKQTAGFQIVGWNSLGFDFRVLAEAVNSGSEGPDRARQVTDLARTHVDPAFLMLCQMGYMVGLGKLAEANDLPGKTEGIDGLAAIEMWGQGREAQDKVIAYVKQDALATAAVYEYLNKSS